MVDLILPQEIRKEIMKFKSRKAFEIECMIGDAMACKPMSAWRFIDRIEFRDDIKTIHVEIWTYMNKPFLKCVTHLRPDGQLQFELERINDAKITIAK